MAALQGTERQDEVGVLRVAVLPFDVLAGRDVADMLAREAVEDRTVLGREPDMLLQLPHERVIHARLRSDRSRAEGVRAGPPHAAGAMIRGRLAPRTGPAAASRGKARRRRTVR